MNNDTIQNASFILSFFGVVFWTIWIIRSHHLHGYAVAPMSFLLHTFIFYLCDLYLFPNITPKSFYTNWSSILRLHGVFVLTFSPILLFRTVNRK